MAYIQIDSSLKPVTVNAELLYQQKQRLYWLEDKIKDDATIPTSVKESVAGVVEMLDAFTDKMLKNEVLEVEYQQGDLKKTYMYFNDDRMTPELYEYEIAKELKA
jgi:hypothetical protein